MATPETLPLTRRPRPDRVSENSPAFSPAKLQAAVDAALARAREEGRTLFLYDLAGEIPVHPNTLANWLAGRGEPSGSQAMKIASILGVEFTALYE